MANPALTPSILQTLLDGLSRTVARGAANDPVTVETAAALLESFHPQTPIQAMLAAQAVALHHAAMDCFGRAMQAGEDDGAAVTRLQRYGASLTRAFTATLHTLQRCQIAAAQAAEVERQDLMQREEAAAPAKVRAQVSSPDAEVAALAPRFREDDGIGHPAVDFAKNPLQQPAPGPRPRGEPLAGPAKPAEQPSPHRPWEELTEAEQFAILYPDRVAAGATSHEHADLWLGKRTKQPQPLGTSR